MIKVILALVVAAHGIGHILFLVHLLGIADWGQSSQSWLLNGLIGENGSRIVGGILYGLSLIGFCIVAYGLFSEQIWWRNAAVIAAVVSTVALILFWVMPIRQPAIAALIFNIVLVGALLFAHWPTPEMVGA